MRDPPAVVVSMVATRHNRHQWGDLFARYRRPGAPWLRPVLRLLQDFGDPSIRDLSIFSLRQPCAAPYHFVSVLWDGSVVPCCLDHDGSIVLGNLREQSLQEIWTGEAAVCFRERWRAHHFTDDEPCSRCRWRIDRFLGDGTLALTDAWSERDWPEEPLP